MPTSYMIRSFWRRFCSSFFSQPSFFTRWELSFFQIIKSLPDSVLVTTTSGNIYYVNPAWEKLTGYSCKEVKGKNPSLLKSGKTNLKIFAQLWRSLAAGKVFSTEKIVSRKKSGKEYQVHSTFFPLLIDNRTTFYVQVQHDITHRVMLEKQKNQTISVASHELKGPITVIKLLMENIKRKTPPHLLNQFKLDIVEQQVDVMAHLISNMLDVSRIEAGKMVLDVSNLDLTLLIRNNVSKTNLLLKRKIRLFQPRKPVFVMGDKYRLDQVLTNLLNNAIKFSPKDSLIKVRTKVDGNQVVVSVSDQGRGIAAKNTKKIFKRYVQVSYSKGLGLGLAISKEIIQKHHGRIGVASQLGKGSTFFFSLPIKNNSPVFISSAA